MNRQRLDSPLVYVGAHNVVRVMLKRPLLDSHPAAAFLYITPLCAPIFVVLPSFLETLLHPP